jgi:hypothetical protein
VLFLGLHIAGNAAFLLLVRVGRSRRFAYGVVGLANYATAAAIAVATLAAARLASMDGRAVLFGAVNGAQYQVTYLLMYVLLGMAGVAVTTSLMRLSVAVPVLASIGVWREWPTPVQAAGLSLAAVALPLLSSSARRQAQQRAGLGERGPSRLGVGALVGSTILISGCGLLAAKAFAELAQPAQRPVYVAAAYVVATLLSVFTWPWRPRPVALAGVAEGGMRGAGRRRLVESVALGVVVGTLNVAQLSALLPALAQVPGIVAFPLAAAGGLALATCGAWLFWREPLGGRTGTGIALTGLAAALANAR